MRELFALPCRHGGLGIPNLLFLASTQYSNSLALSEPFIPLVLSQSDQIPSCVLEQQTKIKSSIHSQNRRISKDNSLTVREKLSPSLQRLFDIANEKGVSSWLTVIPIKAHGFDLHKGDFRDSLCLRYGWNPPSLPSTSIFNPTAHSCRNRSLTACYRRHELEKRRLLRTEFYR